MVFIINVAKGETGVYDLLQFFGSKRKFRFKIQSRGNIQIARSENITARKGGGSG